MMALLLLLLSLLHQLPVPEVIPSSVVAAHWCPKGWTFNEASEHCEFRSTISPVSQAEERERYTDWLRLRRAFVDACERTPLAFMCARPLTPYAVEQDRSFGISIRRYQP